MNNSTGILAAESGFTLPLQVLKSGRGYYVGTANHEGPVSRESEEYFSSHKKVVQAFTTGAWTQREWA
ncbi:hypothetical protein LU631_07670 [Erwinia tracheiphila]|uniref:Uncharacterized protein n=1 Tax=Erwinia tracheiphila TaxID=65700 RepID=A0A0M2KA69_9GAMM|nr:hypothetical protein [Erwinia tracheiphila]EOS94206.1 hypothetical protein ETR_15126 [Erwinia tracheiphila PSU-1]KKF34123.1 hypothetical protein SY86_24135 [Erwinia tracheiphila]UIA89132.1 hypothetical protein LU631_07670 [Erwinia tracheiphila]UIA97513.1 hypothetical protein LU633_06355 [Erwinia tracheiphila]